MNAMGFLRATVEVGRQTVLLLLQNRLLWVVGAAQLALPALSYLLGGTVGETQTGRHVYAVTTWGLFVFVLVPWTTLYCGVQAVHGDIEDRTFQYLFLRPVPRAALLLGKLLAVAALSTALFVFGAVAWFLGFAARSALWPEGVEFELVAIYAQAIAMAAAANAAVRGQAAAAARVGRVLHRRPADVDRQPAVEGEPPLPHDHRPRAPVPARPAESGPAAGATPLALGARVQARAHRPARAEPRDPRRGGDGAGPVLLHSQRIRLAGARVTAAGRPKNGR
jgi:hypothetical protein